jgi:L-2-hydroxyglutarate oxidase
MQDVAIVGAGIVGLATAYQMLQKKPGTAVLVLDKEKEVAAHQTGHNSGVIHSGIYYRPGSLKALNCRKGYAQLLEFCQKYGIAHEICGKVIVATREEEKPLLHQIYKRGIENGLSGLRLLSANELQEREPHVNGLEAILVPQAGIINYKSVAVKYRELIEQLGGKVVTGQKVVAIRQFKEGLVIETPETEHRARMLVNCAGLYADKIAKLTGQKLDVQILPFRGEYYVLSKEKQYLVNHLIYPVPNPAFPFLGVHYTRMIDGGIEAGPNAVLAFRREGYNRWDFHAGELAEILLFRGFQKLAAKYWKLELGELHRSFSKTAFVKALQHLVPTVGFDDLERGGAGVRAQAVDSNGNTVDDFLILENQRFVNVINAPSPAATASLAVGETIADIALKKL